MTDSAATVPQSIRILGYIAAALTSASFFPQAIKILRSDDTSAISLRMYLLFTLGIATWAVYGLLTSDGPVLLANLVTLVPAGIVLNRKLQSLRR